MDERETVVAEVTAETPTIRAKYDLTKNTLRISRKGHEDADGLYWPERVVVLNAEELLREGDCRDLALALRMAADSLDPRRTALGDPEARSCGHTCRCQKGTHA